MILIVNGNEIEVEVDPSTPILWVLRDHLDLTGTKFGCGIAQCGACTVHMDGQPIRSCIMPIAAAQGRSLTTIEGVGDTGLHPVQQAWMDHSVPQCGYCQAGQIMSTIVLLQNNPSPTDDDIDVALAGNLCRCGTYPRIRKAVHAAAQRMQEESEEE
jgi:isoquinoline 1-oxidoreductase alpha subunit